MSAIIDVASGICFAAGAFFCIAGGVGLIRMPDCYTRMHAASVIETLGAAFILLGFMLQAGFTLVAVKLVMIGLLIFFTSPAATHALAKTAFARGLVPRLAPAEDEPSKR